MANAATMDRTSEQGPTLTNGRYVFAAGDLALEVAPDIGGRVTRFSFAGTNILTGPDVVAAGPDTTPNMYGSTFWTSPQSTWSWPPEVALDSAPLRAAVNGTLLSLQSDAGAITGYAVQKNFSLDAEKNKVIIEYVLQNQRASVKAAPWEISRVPKEGIVLFAAASPAQAESTLPAQFAGGIAWVDIASAPAMDSKLYQDGAEGWLAYVYRDLVFIKVWDDVAAADQATGEAEIEVFVNGLYDYVEIEQQGPYVALPVGAASSWRVSWLLRRPPAALDKSLGSAELVLWVRDQVRSAR